MTYAYDPDKQIVYHKQKEAKLYCGPELNDTAIIILDFYFHGTTLQETFTRLMTVNEIAKNVSTWQANNNEAELTTEIERQISSIKIGDSNARVMIQDVNKLIELMGGDIVFTIDNSQMINHYLMLLLIKKFLTIIRILY